MGGCVHKAISSIMFVGGQGGWFGNMTKRTEYHKERPYQACMLTYICVPLTAR